MVLLTKALQKILDKQRVASPNWSGKASVINACKSGVLIKEGYDFYTLYSWEGEILTYGTEVYLSTVMKNFRE